MNLFNRLLLTGLAGVFTTCANCAEAEIITAWSDTDVERVLSQADSNTLVLFDCDNVLISRPYTISSVTARPNMKCIEELLEKEDKEKRKHLKNYLKGYINDFSLMSKNWVKTVRSLQQKGVRAAVLTSHKVGKLDHFNATYEDIRKCELASFGFRFQDSWPNVGRIEFKELGSGNSSGRRVSDPPVFDGGIIFAGNISKDEVLRAFLMRVPRYNCNKIIFTDDSEENIRKIDSLCRKRGISYIGVLYRKIDTRYAMKTSKAHPIRKWRNSKRKDNAVRKAALIDESAQQRK